MSHHSSLSATHMRCWLSTVICDFLPLCVCTLSSQLCKLSMQVCCNSKPTKLRRALLLLRAEWLVQSGFIWGGSQQKTRILGRWVSSMGLFAVHVLASLDTGSKQTLTGNRGLYRRCGRTTNARRTSEDLAENMYRPHPRCAGKDILCEVLHERNVQAWVLRLLGY